MDIGIIKQVARSQLTNHWGTAILTTLIVSALTGAAAAAAGVGALIVGGPLAVGSAVIYLGFLRRNEAQIGSVFDGFRDSFVNSFVAHLLTGLYVFLWSLLFVIPGIVKALGYAMTPYILADIPDMDGQEAMRLSQRMMDGYKGKLLCLHLSFIGWYLLSALTFGILAIVYVSPWEQESEAAFYDQLRRENPQPELCWTQK
jgi:uncharacterized membrane protein